MPYTGSGTPCRQLRWAMPPFLPCGRHSVSPNGRSIIGSILFIAFFLISRLYIIYFNLYIIHFYIYLLTYIRSRINIYYSFIKNWWRNGEKRIPMRNWSHRDFFVYKQPNQAYFSNMYYSYDKALPALS